MSQISKKILMHFDEAAPRYDQQARVQMQVADYLINWATPHATPQDALDIGSGTGFVSEAVAKRWPLARITALDHAPAMLQQAQRKLPQLKTIIGDAAHMHMEQRFDILFSSMMLHWLPQPIEALKLWQTWLKPGGRMYVALLTDGSFQEWRDLCSGMNVKGGLWPMPCANFADALTAQREQQPIAVTYASAHDFLRRLKTIGAATPRPDHKPMNAAIMRRLLTQAPKPFRITYQVLYIDIPSQGKV